GQNSHPDLLNAVEAAKREIIHDIVIVVPDEFASDGRGVGEDREQDQCGDAEPEEGETARVAWRGFREGWRERGVSHRASGAMIARRGIITANRPARGGASSPSPCTQGEGVTVIVASKSPRVLGRCLRGGGGLPS